jgi:RimJ/RimL family protein N-acetyltransferase
MSELRGERVVLRPTGPPDVEPLRAIRETPAVKDRWGALEKDFPLGDEPTATRFTIFADGEPAGMIQYTEEQEPDYRNAEVDIFLDPGHHNRGLGTDAMSTLARHLVEDRGHHRLTLSTAVDNAQAIRSYEKAGFRRIGVAHAAARDPRTGGWGDELMMELVVRPELARPEPAPR